MSFFVAQGTFGITTGALNSTVAVTTNDPNFGSFQPKVVIFSWTGGTANGQAEADHKFGMGYMVGATDRGCVTTQSDHGNTTMATDDALYDDACIALLTIAGAVDGKADFNSFTATGFTVIIDDVFVANYLIHYLAFGGTDLTNVQSVTSSPGTGTGSFSETGFSFQPDCAIFFGNRDVINSIGVDSVFTFGVAAGAGTPTNYVLAGTSDDAQATSATASYCRAGECNAFITTSGGVDAAVYRAAVTGWLSNGYTLNKIENSLGAQIMRVLCLKGGRYAAGDILTLTDTTNTIVETGLGFAPLGLLFASHGKTQSTADTPQADDERTVGFWVFSGAGGRSDIGVFDKDNSAIADIGVSDGLNVYTNQSNAATIVVEGLMGTVSLDVDGFTLAMADADPAQAFVWYLAVGANAPTAFVFPRTDRRIIPLI